MITSTTVAPIEFKQDFSPQNGWLNYGLAITILLIAMLVLAKKYKFRAPIRGSVQLVEKKHLGNKTVVYIIEYEQKHFLLADNQQALAIHALESGQEKHPVGASGALPSTTNNRPQLGQETGEKPLAPTSHSNRWVNHEPV